MPLSPGIRRSVMEEQEESVSRRAEFSSVASEGKRRRDGLPIEEDVKDNLKVARQWFGSPRAENGMKEGYQNNLQFQGLSVENLIWMQQQQKKSEMAATTAVSPSLNMQQRVMAAAALHDLRGINESSKLFFQPHLQQHMKYGMQQQQPALQKTSMPIDSSACSVREPSSSQSPQSPLQPPLPPSLRTPPLYSEADVHNNSPTSSSSGPYPGLSNMAGPRSSQPNSAPIQLPKVETDISFSSMLQSAQNSFPMQQPGQTSHNGQFQAQQPVYPSSSGKLPQHQGGHSPEVPQLIFSGSNVGKHPQGGSQGTVQHENGHTLDSEIPRQGGNTSHNFLVQQPLNHTGQSGSQISSQNKIVNQQNSQSLLPAIQSATQNGNSHHQNSHTSSSAHQGGMQNGTAYQQGGHGLTKGLQTGMHNGNIHVQGAHMLQNGLQAGGQNGGLLSQGESLRIDAPPLLQSGHMVPNGQLHQQFVHSSSSGLPSGTQNGPMHLQSGHRLQSGRLSQNGMDNQHSGCGTSIGSATLQFGQGGPGGMPQQQGGLPPTLREFQGMHHVPGFWSSSTSDPRIMKEAQPSARLQKREMGPSSSGPTMGNAIFSSSLTDFSSQKELAAVPAQVNQGHAGLRDVTNDNDLHPQEGQSTLQTVGSIKACGAPSTRLGKVLPLQTDLNGRRSMQGGLCAPSRSGADSNFSSPMTMANGAADDSSILQRNIMCPPKFTRSYTKVYKLGSITRAVDVNRFSNYTEMRRELARMFNLEGQLDQKLGWQLVFTDNEDDLLLVGDDPWEEFVRTVRGIRILTPAEVSFYTNEDKCGTAYNSLGAGASKQS